MVARLVSFVVGDFDDALLRYRRLLHETLGTCRELLLLARVVPYEHLLLRQNLRRLVLVVDLPLALIEGSDILSGEWCFLVEVVQAWNDTTSLVLFFSLLDGAWADRRQFLPVWGNSTDSIYGFIELDEAPNCNVWLVELRKCFMRRCLCFRCVPCSWICLISVVKFQFIE